MKVMYDGGKLRIERVHGCFSKGFVVTVGVHYGTALSQLLFATVIEAFSLVIVALAVPGRSYIQMIWSS